MSNVTTQDPVVEYFDLGVIDEFGKLRVLVGGQFLTINCLPIFERAVTQTNACQYNCSHFSGPSKDESTGDIVVRLMCSGRTFHFKRFANALTTSKLNYNLDLEKMSDLDILTELGITEQQVQ